MSGPAVQARQAPVTLFLCGDVMLGRGIDQAFARHNLPDIREDYLRDARDYLRLAEAVHGRIETPVRPTYVWGEALAELDRVAPDARLINLETSVTTHGQFWPGKGVHYRLHPENVASLTGAHIDACVLANNHVLDFGEPGLLETLRTLRAAGIQTAGAGEELDRAWAPARVGLRGGGTLALFGVGTPGSGIPPSWAATAEHPGLAVLPELTQGAAEALLEQVQRFQRPGELVLVSIHWGNNWGYAVPWAQVAFARRLIEGGVDLVHGHSSHHPRPLEVYRGKLILYGCGDFISDYEGITGYEEFRGELRLMYLPRLDPRTGTLEELRIVPFSSERLRLRRASVADGQWLGATLTYVSRDFGTQVLPTEEGALVVRGGG